MIAEEYLYPVQGGTSGSTHNLFLFAEEYPSGSRGQFAKLLAALPARVRISPPPPVGKRKVWGLVWII